jgi:hypothetical protein
LGGALAAKHVPATTVYQTTSKHKFGQQIERGGQMTVHSPAVQRRVFGVRQADAAGGGVLGAGGGGGV